MPNPEHDLEVSPGEAWRRSANGEKLCWLDVRQPEEHELVSLPNSVLIPLGALPWRVEEIGGWREREIIVYCHHGVRSLQAVRWLREAGFHQARSLAGGIDRWASEIDPELARY